MWAAITMQTETARKPSSDGMFLLPTLKNRYMAAA